MTLWRWDRSEKMIARGWPPPMRLSHDKATRKFRSRAQLELFKSNVFRAALKDRANMLSAMVTG